MNMKNSEVVKMYYNAHKKAFENWENGEPVNIWIDANGYICIIYKNGKWWHYTKEGSQIVWW